MPTGLENYGALGGVIILGMGALRIIEALVKQQYQKKNGNGSFQPCKLGTECGDNIKRILAATTKTLEMHDKTDTDGIPLWYFPRRMVSLQIKNLELLQQQINNESRTHDLLKQLISEIKEMERH